jgi:L-ascorbate metabolism protein UlaG (beta-lactamase superfamily)
MPTLIYHGHACVEIHGSKAKILIDPFLSGNPLADVKPEQVSCNVILVTHGHSDHLGDTVSIAKRTGATVVATYELAAYLGKKGVKTHAMHIGGAHEFAWGKVKLTNAAHGGMIDGEDGPYFTCACGFLVSIDGSVIYHPGDTALISDMKLVGRFNDLNVALLPIGDNYTMGPEDALEAVDMLMPEIVVPMHYDTFDLIRQDAAKFAKSVEETTSCRCVILKPGQKLDL